MSAFARIASPVGLRDAALSWDMVPPTRDAKASLASPKNGGGKGLIALHCRASPTLSLHCLPAWISLRATPAGSANR